MIKWAVRRKEVKERGRERRRRRRDEKEERKWRDLYWSTVFLLQLMEEDRRRGDAVKSDAKILPRDFTVEHVITVWWCTRAHDRYCNYRCNHHVEATFNTKFKPDRNTGNTGHCSKLPKYQTRYQIPQLDPKLALLSVCSWPSPVYSSVPCSSIVVQQLLQIDLRASLFSGRHGPPLS